MNRDEIHQIITAVLTARGHRQPIVIDEHDECVLFEGMVCSALQSARNIIEFISSIEPILDRPDPADHHLILRSPLGKFRLQITKVE